MRAYNKISYNNVMRVRFPAYLVILGDCLPIVHKLHLEYLGYG